LTNYLSTAWESLKKQGVLSVVKQDGETEVPKYIPRTAACGEPVLHICMKALRGGNKMLLGE